MENHRTIARYAAKHPVIAHYPQLWAVYSSDGKTVVDLLDSVEDYLNLPRSVHVEACGTTYLF